MLYRRIPILNWLPKYSGADALGDLVAGITVGLTVIPQSLAYSNVAGLPAQVSRNKYLFLFYISLHITRKITAFFKFAYFLKYSFFFKFGTKNI